MTRCSQATAEVYILSRPPRTTNGSGICNNGGTVQITNSTVSGNSASGVGSIFSGGGCSTYRIDHLRQLGRQRRRYCRQRWHRGRNEFDPIRKWGGGGGGGACILSGKATFTDSTISGNWSNGTNHNAFGAGIENYGTLTVTDCVIRDNSAYFGGGVYNRGTAAIQNSTIWNNYAFASGGGLYNATGGTLVVSNSTISNNWADCSDGTNEGGGGIFNTQGTLTVTNLTVANNHGCYNGGGIYNDNGPLTVKNSDCCLQRCKIWPGC